MAFEVPPGHDSFSRHVLQQFRGLILTGVIDLVTVTQFDCWRRNFVTPEEDYLAAHLLSAAVVRTRRMLKSSYRQIADVIVPELMRDAGLPLPRDLGELETQLRERDPCIDLRFMPVDGQLLDARPGNSGDGVLRAFGLTAGIGDRYMVRADDTTVWDNPPRLLILLDDLLGTGTQIRNFTRRYPLSGLPITTKCIYVPLIAASQGVERVERECRPVVVRPVERLQSAAAFFAGRDGDPQRWARDGYNTVSGTRLFYRELLRSKGVSTSARYNLDLTVLLLDRAPNNTLKAFWAETGSWTPLFRR